MGPGLPQQRRMSDESIQSGVIETQEMQAIQVLLDNYWKNSFEVACVIYVKRVPSLLT